MFVKETKCLCSCLNIKVFVNKWRQIPLAAECGTSVFDLQSQVMMPIKQEINLLHCYPLMYGIIKYCAYEFLREKKKYSCNLKN